MEEFITAGIVLWLIANAFGLNLGPEFILMLPFIVIIVLIAIMIV